MKILKIQSFHICLKLTVRFERFFTIQIIIVTISEIASALTPEIIQQVRQELKYDLHHALGIASRTPVRQRKRLLAPQIWVKYSMHSTLAK